MELVASSRRRGVRSACLVGLVIVAVGLLGPLGTSPAVADCSGPTIIYEAGEVDRGDTILVEGSGWGDNCYDTGPPPPGEGTLGNPIGDIEIVLLQDDTETVVAEGNADADYAFEVEVVVPSTLLAGEATTVIARAGAMQGFDNTNEPLLVSDAPGDPELDGIVTFGPADEPVEEEGESAEGGGESAAPDDGSSGVPTWLLIVVGVALLAVLAGVLFTRSDAARE